MNKFDIYPGRLIRDLVVTGVLRSGEYKMVAEKIAPDFTFVLAPRYFAGETKLAPGVAVSGPVVVLTKMAPKSYRVALRNYDEELFEEIYPAGWNTVVYKTPWIDHWRSIFNDEFDGGTLKIRENAASNRWSVGMPWAILPVRASSHLKYIDGDTYLFPDNLFSNKKKQHNQYALYRPQTKFSWPKAFTGRLKIHFAHNQENDRSVRVFLHGFLEALQWHYKLWKHLTDDKRVSSFPGSVGRWNQHFDENIPETLSKIIFKDCQPPKGDTPHGCRGDCPPKRFKDVCRKIKHHNEKYLKQAVTFFSTCPSNIVKIKPIANNFQIVKFSDFEFRKVVAHNESATPTVIKLILRGYCFDWHLRENETPTIHLYIVTFFAGPAQEGDERFPSLLSGSALQSSGDTDILAMAQFSNIKEVRQ